MLACSLAAILCLAGAGPAAAAPADERSPASRVSAPSAPAQSPSPGEDDSWSGITGRLEANARLAVTDHTGRTVRGRFVTATVDGIAIDTSEGVRTVPRRDVSSITRPDRLVNGAQIGAGVGAGVGLWMLRSRMRRNQEGIGDSVGDTLLVIIAVPGLGAGIGAALGALVDAVIPGERRVYVAPRVALRPELSQRRTALRVSIQF